DRTLAEPGEHAEYIFEISGPYRSHHTLHGKHRRPRGDSRARQSCCVPLNPGQLRHAGRNPPPASDEVRLVPRPTDRPASRAPNAPFPPRLDGPPRLLSSVTQAPSVRLRPPADSGHPDAGTTSGGDS